MAELVDASDSKSGIGNNVQVRFLFWALDSLVNQLFTRLFYLLCVIFVRFFTVFSTISDTQMTRTFMGTNRYTTGTPML